MTDTPAPTPDDDPLQQGRDRDGVAAVAPADALPRALLAARDAAAGEDGDGVAAADAGATAAAERMSNAQEKG